MRRFVKGFVSLGLALSLGLSGSAWASDKSVAEEILDVLHESGQITDRQYQELLKKARAEDRAGAESGPVDPSTFRVYWDKGIRMDTADKRFKLKVGGRLQSDWAAFREDSDIETQIGEFGNGAEFRRARLYVAGTIYDRVKFKAQYDFAGGDADFKDAYLELTKIPVLGSLRVGHFKEPYSLEELTSSKYITFMERSIANFAPSRNVGVMVRGHAANQRVTWAAGGFWDSDDFGATDTDEGEDRQFNVTGRATALPVFEDKGKKLVHVGFSYSHKFRKEDGLRFRQRPEAHLAAFRVVDTGTILSGSADLFTPELAIVCGPLSLQAEYTWVLVNAVGQDDPEFQGYYAQLSYFLTGEHRKYKATDGAFSRVSPIRDFLSDGGWGAWEAAVRFSRVDLHDEMISGGHLGDVTVGLNWHLNPNVRVMFNFVRARRGSIGDIDIGEGRFQVDF